tara:strand:- start:851 stop:1090 length:240 start_codon:yes stop_codon:yes gene_type:complete
MVNKVIFQHDIRDMCRPPRKLGKSYQMPYIDRAQKTEWAKIGGSGSLRFGTALHLAGTFYVCLLHFPLDQTGLSLHPGR